MSGGYTWKGEDEAREIAVGKQLKAIREEAKRRTGWEEWMTEEVGWGALDPDFVRLSERRDSGR